MIRKRTKIALLPAVLTSLLGIATPASAWATDPTVAGQLAIGTPINYPGYSGVWNTNVPGSYNLLALVDGSGTLINVPKSTGYILFRAANGGPTANGPDGNPSLAWLDSTGMFTATTVKGVGSNTSSGVLGFTGGDASGVVGETATNDTTQAGVYGYSTGQASGVLGTSAASGPSSAGVTGTNSNTVSGYGVLGVGNQGVVGNSVGGGIGVTGYAPGGSNGTAGTGVYGTAPKGTGISGVGGIGVSGVTVANGTYGVYGSTAANAAYGVFGNSTGSGGAAVYGISAQSNGVMGYTYAAQGYAVYAGNMSGGIALNAQTTGASGGNAVYASTQGTNGAAVYANVPGSSNLSFQGNGGITIGGTATKPGGGSWTATSDIRVKKNIESFEDGLASLEKVRPIRFRYNGLGGTSDDGKRYVGVVAQEIEQVAPDMVSEKMAKLNKGDTSETAIKRVDPSAFTYMLINAVKELKAKSDEQERRIETLSRELETLRADR